MEVLIKRRLESDGELCARLAKFNGESAIFFHKAPADSARATYFPQIILSTEKYDDPQKGVAGNLVVDILCTQGTTPEQIEELVRKRLAGIFFRGEEIFALKWQRSEFFTEKDAERLPLIVGITAEFQIYEFPSAQTSEPDLINALNNWAAQFPDLKVIGRSEFDSFLEPSATSPAIYFSVEKIDFGNKILNAVAWIQATVNLHLFCPDLKAKRQWLNYLHDILITQAVVFLGDGSPARLQSSSWNWQATETAGQIQLRYEYGLRRIKLTANPITGKEYSFETKPRWR